MNLGLNNSVSVHWFGIMIILGQVKSSQCIDAMIIAGIRSWGLVCVPKMINYNCFLERVDNQDSEILMYNHTVTYGMV